MVQYFLIQVAIVRIVHYDTELIGAVIKKGFFVLDYVGMLNRCQYSDFIKCVFLLSVWQVHDFDLFESIALTVKSSSDQIDSWIGAFS